MTALKVTLASLACILVLTLIAFYSGFVGNMYDATVTKQSMNIQRKNFEQSQSYMEGKIQDLAKAKHDYDLAKSDADKQTILNYINSSFASFDANNITDPGLYNFLLKARGE